MNHYRFKILLLFPIAIVFSSCGPAGRLTTGATASTACSFSWSGQSLQWVPVTDTNGLGLVPQIATTRLPDTFAVFTINEQQLRSFLDAVSNHDTATPIIMSLPIPAPPHCVSLELAPSGILSNGLSDRFPGLISLKGISKSDPQVTARIDYAPKTKLKAAITYHHEVFLISPWPGKDRTYYLVYRKEAAGYEKIPYQEY